MSISISNFWRAYRQDQGVRVLSWILVVLFGALAVMLSLTYDRMFNTQAWQEHVRQEVEAERMSSDGKKLYTDPETRCTYFIFYGDGIQVLSPRFGKDGRVMGCGRS